MFKKLRTKFIIVAMVATALVLLLIIGGINIYNYVEIDKKASETLSLLERNDGKFPREHEPQGQGAKGISPEAPFETRFFTVMFKDGAVAAVNIDKIAAVDAETAAKYAEEVYASNKTEGFKNNYKYLKTTAPEGDVMIIFLDCTRDLSTFYEFLEASLIMSFVGLAVVAVLVFVLSGVVMKPVAETYKKQKQFITDANHELKTPLTVISASCDVLEMESGENEWTKTIKSEVVKLTELTNKLVFLSRMDEGSANSAKTEFSLTEVVEDATKRYAVISESENKKFDTQIEQNVTINGDISEMRELVDLLLDNAFKYSDEEGNVRLELQKVNGKSRLTVSNTTAGVPQGDLSVLFERFYRLDSSRNSATGGHGIGLSVAKAIVEQHKGKITARSADGKTIIFTVTL